MREARLAVKEASRGKKGSQGWLAHATGAHPTSISDWERGENEPSPRYITKLASALGVSTDELLSDDDEEEASLPLKSEQEFLEALRPLAQLLAKNQVAA